MTIVLLLSRDVTKRENPLRRLPRGSLANPGVRVSVDYVPTTAHPCDPAVAVSPPAQVSSVRTMQTIAVPVSMTAVIEGVKVARAV
jgi:hypothetical protein